MQSVWSWGRGTGQGWSVLSWVVGEADGLEPTNVALGIYMRQGSWCLLPPAPLLTPAPR
jgi:hypothetical protein